MQKTNSPHFLADPPNLEVVHGPETQQEHGQIQIIFEVDFEEINIGERAVVDIVVLRVLDAVARKGHHQKREKDDQRGERSEDRPEMAQILAL